MKKIPLPIIFLILSLTVYSQDPAPEDLLKEGIALHDKGDYAGAIKKYDEILSHNDGFYMAYNEKSFSLYMAGKYDECVELSKKTLKKFPDSAKNRNIYVNYGSALDALGRSDDAIHIYKEGMRKYPDFYLLPFNKGVTEYRLKKYDDAIEDFQRSATLNPSHASSHQFLAYAIYPTNRIAAAMALSAFLVLEPSGQRAEKNLKILLSILKGNAEKKDEKNISVSLSMADLNTNEKTPDNFSTIQMMITLSGATDLTKDSVSEMKKLEDKLEMLAMAAPAKKGFFSNYYVTWLAGLKENHFLETAAYLISAAAGDADDQKWLTANKDKVEALTQWTEQHLGK